MPTTSSEIDAQVGRLRSPLHHNTFAPQLLDHSLRISIALARDRRLWRNRQALTSHILRCATNTFDQHDTHLSSRAHNTHGEVVNPQALGEQRMNCAQTMKNP
eukprot:5507249-Pyramimonas_sp.AAC.1